MTDKIAKAIRGITIAPVMACVMLILVYINNSQVFGGTGQFIGSVFCLTILPVLAYPLQRYFPHFKEKGREGQRTLAMIFAVSGYVLGCITNLLSGTTKTVLVIYLEYLLSGLLILGFNKLLGLRASGHACGVTGPLLLLLYFGIPFLIEGILVLALTWWASLKMKRHTLKQLIGGTCIPIVVILILKAGNHII